MHLPETNYNSLVGCHGSEVLGPGKLLMAAHGYYFWSKCISVRITLELCSDFAVRFLDLFLIFIFFPSQFSSRAAEERRDGSGRGF